MRGGHFLATAFAVTNLNGAILSTSIKQQRRSAIARLSPAVIFSPYCKRTGRLGDARLKFFDWISQCR
jgi:hypothetical protein